MLHCQPLEERRHPQDSSDAKYSIPFSTANSCYEKEDVDRGPDVGGIGDPEVAPDGPEGDPMLDLRFDQEKGEPPGMVEITTKGRQSYAHRLEVGYGHPQNPISTEDIIRKFRIVFLIRRRPSPRTLRIRLSRWL